MSASIIAIIVLAFIVILTVLWVKQFDTQTKRGSYLIYGNEKVSLKSDSSRVSFSLIFQVIKSDAIYQKILTDLNNVICL